MVSTTQAVWPACIVALTATAIVFDLRWRRIPNWLTVMGFVLGVAYHVARGAAGGGPTGALGGLVTALGGFATGFGLLLVMWLVGGSGGGDVKLMGAVGTWLGSLLTLYVLVASAVVIVLGGFAVLVASFVTAGPAGWRRHHLGTVAPGPGQTAAEARARRRLMPFALPLGLGAWVIVAWALLAPLGPR